MSKEFDDFEVVYRKEQEAIDEWGNSNKIELTKIKVFPRFSEETISYAAIITQGGVPIGDVSNRGEGAPDRIQASDGADRTIVYHEHMERFINGLITKYCDKAELTKGVNRLKKRAKARGCHYLAYRIRDGKIISIEARNRVTLVLAIADKEESDKWVIEGILL